MASDLVFSTEVEGVHNVMIRLNISRYHARQLGKDLWDFFTEGRAYETSKTIWLRGAFLPIAADKRAFLDSLPEAAREEVAEVFQNNVVLSRMVDQLGRVAHDHELLYKQQKERAEAAEAELRKITSGECTAD